MCCRSIEWYNKLQSCCKRFLCSQLIAGVQVVNVDDLKEILGARPYTTVESRNIDKYRDGFDKPKLEPEHTPGGSSEGSEGGKEAPGDVVDGPDRPQAPPTPTEVPGEMPGVQPGPKV